MTSQLVSTDRLDIRAEVRALCEKFGVEYHATAEIVIKPNEASATVYERNENGKFFVREDGEPAKDNMTFKVKT